MMIIPRSLPEKLNVLILGGGGREDALAWKLRQSPFCKNLYIAPGNGGQADGERVALSVTDTDALIQFARDKSIGLTVVGPEQPLVDGIVDKWGSLVPEGRIVGPSAAAAQLEGSKLYCREVLAAAGVPQPRFAVSKSAGADRSAIEQTGFTVVKYDGLAGGKGVIVANSIAEAITAAATLRKEHGDDCTLLFEERLTGLECSFIVQTDGVDVMPFVLTRDHKRALAGDKGPNTGGMAAYTCETLTAQWSRTLCKQIAEPIINRMHDMGLRYRGVLYVGIMMTDDGPKVLECNVRFGDPECQPLMLKLGSDLLPYLWATAGENELAHLTPMAWRSETAACLVVASLGYPGTYPKGNIIHGLGQEFDLGQKIFHAGTHRTLVDGLPRYTVSGGRVVGVTALGSPACVMDVAYHLLTTIRIEGGMHFRQDIEVLD